MHELSPEEVSRTLSIILAAARGPLRIKEIQNRFERGGYHVTRAQIIHALRDGPFRSRKQGWSLALPAQASKSKHPASP